MGNDLTITIRLPLSAAALGRGLTRATCVAVVIAFALTVGWVASLDVLRANPSPSGPEPPSDGRVVTYNRSGSSLIVRVNSDPPSEVYEAVPKTGRRMFNGLVVPTTPTAEPLPGLRRVDQWKYVTVDNPNGSESWTWARFRQYAINLWWGLLPVGLILVVGLLMPALRRAAWWWFTLLPRWFQRRHTPHPDPAFPVILKDAGDSAQT